MKYIQCMSACSSMTSCRSCCSSGTDYSEHSRSHTYKRIKTGLRKSNPAAIVLWAFHNLPSQNGLTSRKVIGFIKKHYRAVDDPSKTGKSISAIIRCAVEFGLLQKRGNKFYLAANR